jgi:hypothetical protein
MFIVVLTRAMKRCRLRILMSIPPGQVNYVMLIKPCIYSLAVAAEPD